MGLVWVCVAQIFEEDGGRSSTAGDKDQGRQFGAKEVRTHRLTLAVKFLGGQARGVEGTRMQADAFPRAVLGALL